MANYQKFVSAVGCRPGPLRSLKRVDCHQVRLRRRPDFNNFFCSARFYALLGTWQELGKKTSFSRTNLRVAAQ